MKECCSQSGRMPKAWHFQCSRVFIKLSQDWKTNHRKVYSKFKSLGSTVGVHCRVQSVVRERSRAKCFKGLMSIQLPASAQFVGASDAAPFGLVRFEARPQIEELLRNQNYNPARRRGSYGIRSEFGSCRGVCLALGRSANISKCLGRRSRPYSFANSFAANDHWPRMIQVASSRSHSRVDLGSTVIECQACQNHAWSSWASVRSSINLG